jgi:hypothetical protein
VGFSVWVPWLTTEGTMVFCSSWAIVVGWGFSVLDFLLPDGGDDF